MIEPQSQQDLKADPNKVLPNQKLHQELNGFENGNACPINWIFFKSYGIFCETGDSLLQGDEVDDSSCYYKDKHLSNLPPTSFWYYYSHLNL